MPKQIQIDTAANGYIAYDRESGRMMEYPERHVFESFDSLVKWLKQQLTKPEKTGPGNAKSRQPGQ